MDDANSIPPLNDPFDEALQRYAQHFEQFEPSPGLPAAIILEIQALRHSQTRMPSATAPGDYQWM